MKPMAELLKYYMKENLLLIPIRDYPLFHNRSKKNLPELVLRILLKNMRPSQ